MDHSLLRKTGVYVILNVLNGKRYVGSAAQSFYMRWAAHRSRLARGIHKNLHLQAAWDKYGESAFEFLIVELCAPSKCVEFEQRFIDDFSAADPSTGYNLAPIAGSSRGCKLSPEAIAKRTAGRRGISEETRAKMIAAARNRSPETRRKLSEAASRRRFKHAPETVRKIQESRRGYRHSEETRTKISLGLLSHHQS